MNTKIFNDHIDSEMANCMSEDVPSKNVTETMNFREAIAELDNAAKRYAKEMQKASIERERKILCKMLNVYDDLKIIVKSIETTDVLNTPEMQSAVAGYTLLYNKLLSELSGVGCFKMQIGKHTLFNTDYHDAISTTDTHDKQMDNVIADVQKDGFIYNGSVLRYAKVVVYKYV